MTLSRLAAIVNERKVRRWWPWSELRRLRAENDKLRADVADQAQKIQALRRVFDFFGFDVNLED
jgi:hypothetical protein